MRFMRRRVLLPTLMTAAIAVGIGVAAPAGAAPIENGGIAQIATQLVGGTRYCIIPTSELRACGVSPAVSRYTFIARTCWSTGLLCYEIRTGQNECLYHDVELTKIGYSTNCGSTDLTYRWRIDELNSFGTVRMRPASHTSRCVVYDPARLPGYPYTFIQQCSSRPDSHAWLRLLRA
jgi:hypothetical protein